MLRDSSSKKRAARAERDALARRRVDDYHHDNVFARIMFSPDTTTQVEKAAPSKI